MQRAHRGNGTSRVAKRFTRPINRSRRLVLACFWALFAGLCGWLGCGPMRIRPATGATHAVRSSGPRPTAVGPRVKDGSLLMRSTSSSPRPSAAEFGRRARGEPVGVVLIVPPGAAGTGGRGGRGGGAGPRLVVAPGARRQGSAGCWSSSAPSRPASRGRRDRALEPALPGEAHRLYESLGYERAPERDSEAPTAAASSSGAISPRPGQAMAAPEASYTYCDGLAGCDTARVTAPVPARDRAARGRRLRARHRAARAGRAAGAGEDLGARGARPRLLPRRALRRRPRSSSRRSSRPTRSTTTPTSASAAR